MSVFLGYTSNSIPVPGFRAKPAGDSIVTITNLIRLQYGLAPRSGLRPIHHQVVVGNCK